MTIISTLPQFNQPSAYNPCKGMLYIVSPKSAVNLCINPSFEIGFDNWTYSGTLTQSTVAWSGAFSANFTAGTSITYGSPTRFNASAGQQLAISFYIRNQIATTQTYTIRLFNTISGTPVATWTHNAQPNIWQRFIGVALITAGTDFYFTITGTNFYLDAVQIEIVSGHSATTYFDGSTSGTVASSQIAAPQYSWQGKAHSSPSVRNANAANGGLLVNLQNELGFIVIGFYGADIPNYDNQTVKYFGTDGASLQDIIAPPRSMTIVGRIYATSKDELHSKIAIFTKYFSRDITAYRQPKSFLFQHIDDLNNAVGIPLSFSGVTVNTFQVPLSNDFGVQISIQLSMIDPFFYGHDESVQFTVDNQQIFNAVFSYAPEYTQQNGNYSTYLQTAVAGKLDGTINAMAIAKNGVIFFAGSFLNVSGFAWKYIASYNPITNTFSGLGATPTNVFNGVVNSLSVSPDGEYLFIGGAFTQCNGLACNRIVMYFISSNTFANMGGGVGGGVNGTVNAVEVRAKRFGGGAFPYQVYIGGAFTQSTTGVAMSRMAYFNETTQLWTAFGTGNGMNGDVYALRYNNNLDRMYIGGAFTQSNGGALTLNYIAYVNLSTLGTTIAMYSGFNGNVHSIYTDDIDNSVYVGGAFTFLAGGVISMKRVALFNGVQWSQLDLGIDNNIVYNIVPYKNGMVIVGTFTSVNSNAFLSNGIVWFNGQSFYPLSADSRGASYRSAIVSNDNTLYLGGGYTGVLQYFNTGIMATAVNSSTAAASVKWQFYTDADISDLYIHCLLNATQMTQISLEYLNCQTNELVIVDTKTGTIYSDIYGNQTSYILGASGITNMKVLPNNNYLVVMCTCTLPIPVGYTVLLSAIWRQTFNTLFDGINAS